MTNFHKTLKGCQYDRNDRKGASSERSDDRVLDALTYASSVLSVDVSSQVLHREVVAAMMNRKNKTFMNNQHSELE